MLPRFGSEQKPGQKKLQSRDPSRIFCFVATQKWHQLDLHVAFLPFRISIPRCPRKKPISLPPSPTRCAQIRYNVRSTCQPRIGPVQRDPEQRCSLPNEWRLRSGLPLPPSLHHRWFAHSTRTSGSEATSHTLVGARAESHPVVCVCMGR